MPRTVGRTLLWLYAALMLIAALGYARYDSYLMDGDGTAFLDIAQDLRTHHAALAINGYWNPGYPALLAAAETLARTDLWHELAVTRYANVLIFALAMAACLYFTTGLVRARALYGAGDAEAAIPAGALHLLGLGLLTLSLGRELPVAAPRADTLLLALLLCAMGLLLRLYTGARLWAYPVLGVVLGCAYLTKSFAFLPSVALIAAVFLYGAVRKGPARPRILGGAMLLALCFALTAGPYIVAISRQLGHPTTGDSARLNYAFFIDLTPRWHEWYHHDLGHAQGVFLHPEQPIGGPPPVYSFAAHPFGTFPLWFDPAWWTAGLQPHIWLPGHIARFARNCVVFVRFLLGRPEPLILLCLAVAFGARWQRVRRRSELRAHLWSMAPALWGLLMLGIYFPIDLQDRYLTGPLLMVLLSAFAALRAYPASATRELNGHRQTATVATALILLFAGIALSQSGTYLAERRRQLPPADRDQPWVASDIFVAAAALDRLGLQPGDAVACMGDRACFTDHYWARLAGTQILAEVETPGGADPAVAWNNTADKQAVLAPLRSRHLRFLVTRFGNPGMQPPGWIQLGPTDFFAYPL